MTNEIDEVAKEIAQRQEAMTRAFVDNGLSSIKVSVDGANCTLYLRRDVYAKVESNDLLIPALKASGLGSLVKETVNANTLSAKVREWEQDEGGIPHTFQGILSTSEVYSVRMRG